MTHKLPALFQEIINHDNSRPRTSEKVVSINAFREWRERRNVLRDGAKRFVQKQRGGANG